ncbi:MAG: hypothetical protein M0R74_05740 [Dehalococcoidia bacterium]|nr:hypothetical protein [Dehalococcoidia bacterium]
MNWQDDPRIQQQLRERAVRNGILRTALIWTPLFVLAAGALLFFLFDVLTGGERGTWFLLVVLGLFTTLFGFQAVHALLDLRGEPRTTEDLVVRRWSRTDSFVMRSHYVRLAGKQILRGDVDLLDGVREGDRVLVRYYPHSAVILSCERLPAEPLDAAEAPSAEREQR